MKKSPGGNFEKTNQKGGIKVGFVISFIFGFIIGCAIKTIMSRRKSIGELHIDDSDPYDGPYLFLELSNEPMTIKRNSYVTMKVVDVRFTQK